MKFVNFESSMNGHFYNGATGSINVEHIIENLELIIANTYEIAENYYNNRKKPHSLVYQALMILTSDIYYNEYLVKDYPTSKQVEKYFSQFGYDYKELLKPLCDEIQKERNEAKKGL